MIYSLKFRKRGAIVYFTVSARQLNASVNTMLTDATGCPLAMYSVDICAHLSSTMYACSLRRNRLTTIYIPAGTREPPAVVVVVAGQR